MSSRLFRFAVALTALGTLHCGADGSASEPPGMGSGGSYYGYAGFPGAGGPNPGGGAGPLGGAPGGGTGPLGGAPGGGTGPIGGAPAGGTGPVGGSGNGGSGMGGSGPLNVDPVGNANRAPGFVNLAEPPGAPFPPQGTTVNPPPPTGWQYHAIDGAVCRDGSPMGIYVRTGGVNQLLIFFEGGGACSNTGFCRFNPKNMSEILAGDGASVLGSAGGAVPGRMQPGGYSGGVPAGVFDAANAANPFRDWNMVYIPYCTGDVHFGTRTNVTVPWKVNGNVDPRDIAQHQFVGGLNTRKIIARVQPTFPTVTRVVLTGSSAGSFGAALNFSMIQDTYGNTPVTAILDSGIPFEDQYMPACMQRRWRDVWGFALPPDCTECQQADGGGFLGMADFLMRKHPNGKIALVSTMGDEVIRLFFSVGLNNCANYDGGDPVEIFLQTAGPGTYMLDTQYSAAMTAVRTRFQATGKLATFFMPGLLHQHVFRPSFYTATAGGMTLPQWTQAFLDGQAQNVGP